MNAATQGTTTMLEAIDAERTIKDLQGRIDAALVVLDSGDWPPDVVVFVGRILRGEPAEDGAAIVEDVEPTLGSQTGPAPSGGSE